MRYWNLEYTIPFERSCIPRPHAIHNRSAIKSGDKSLALAWLQTLEVSKKGGLLPGLLCNAASLRPLTESSPPCRLRSSRSLRADFALDPPKPPRPQKRCAPGPRARDLARGCRAAASMSQDFHLHHGFCLRGPTHPPQEVAAPAVPLIVVRTLATGLDQLDDAMKGQVPQAFLGRGYTLN